MKNLNHRTETKFETYSGVKVDIYFSFTPNSDKCVKVHLHMGQDVSVTRTYPLKNSELHKGFAIVQEFIDKGDKHPLIQLLTQA